MNQATAFLKRHSLVLGIALMFLLTWPLDLVNTGIVKATAHFEAEVVGENIAAMVKLGTPVRKYDGKVFCFIQTGSEKATYAMFNYVQPPDPKEPTRSMHWFKLAYNKLYWASARGLL